MTVDPGIDPARLLEEQLARASPDLLRQMLQSFINTLLSYLLTTNDTIHS
jgi:putative transposase